ncbi:hypothetical protein [Acinetobacter sp. YH12025]|uniref:hypothetical protein n=1 Tax=Acinetobacter sp. YH12025 TaxID=2601042 RepID=UPI0015D3DF93|nr:hypothetical protein [Acinetobacter sp. YH12025]
MEISQIGDIATILETHTIEGVDKECLDRLSCSKHYYHLFHVVCSWLDTKFKEIFDCAGGGTHQAVRVSCELLADKFEDRNFKKLALKLKQLHDLRVQADYRLADDFSKHAITVMKNEKARALNLIVELDQKYSSGG